MVKQIEGKGDIFPETFPTFPKAATKKGNRPLPSHQKIIRINPEGRTEPIYFHQNNPINLFLIKPFHFTCVYISA